MTPKRRPLEAAIPDVLLSFLSGLRTGPPITLEDVVVVPLLGPEVALDADLLEEGIAARATVVTELDERGDVNRVKVAHGGVRPLLLVDGEELVGAKQNRVLDASLLVAPGTVIVVPVSCVERGRWRHVSASFSSPARTASARLRGSKLGRVADSRTTTGELDADQGAVWRDVDHLLTSSGVFSDSSAYADLAERQALRIETRVERLAPLPGQVGLAAVRGDRLVLLDALGSPALFRRAWRKLARGLVADLEGGSSSPNATDVVTRALAQAAAVPCVRATDTGAGETIHGRAAGLAVGAVAMAGHVYHATIAPL